MLRARFIATVSLGSSTIIGGRGLLRKRDKMPEIDESIFEFGGVRISDCWCMFSFDSLEA